MKFTTVSRLAHRQTIVSALFFLAFVTAVHAAGEASPTWSLRISNARSVLSLSRGVRKGDAAAVLNTAEGLCVTSISNGGASLASTCVPTSFPDRLVSRNGASFLFGNRSVEGSGPEPGWVGRLNAEGQVTWGRQIDAAEPLRLLAADVTEDNGIIVVGSAGAVDLESARAERSFALKVSASGEIEWAREYDSTGYEAFTSVRAVRDGFIVRGIADSGLRVSKLSRDGTVSWDHWFQATRIGEFDVLPDGDIFVVGTATEEQDGAWIARLAPNGDLRWLERSQASIRSLSWVAARPDRTLIAFGTGPTPTSTTVLIAFNPAGEMLWQRALALPPQPFARYAQIVDDGGVVLAITGQDSVEFHKFSSDGEVPECLKPVTTVLAATFVKSEIVRFSHVTETRTLIVRSVDAPVEPHRSNVAVTSCSRAIEPLTMAQEPVTAEQRAAIERFKRLDDQGNELLKRVIALLIGRKFTELDQLASEYRQTGETFATGLSKLALFYRAAITPVPEYGTEQQHMQLIDDWMRTSPTSPAAAVAAAQTRIQYAFRARGGSTANAVTSPAWKRYEELLASAAQILTASAGYAAVDPEYHIARIEIAGSACTDFQNVAFDPGLSRFRYGSLWRIAANFLLPRWCGSEELYRKFAEHAADVTRDQYGQGMYALLANDAVLSDPDRSAVARFKFEWPRIRQGFLDLIRRFPDNLDDYHRLAHIAWFYDDRAAALAMFEKPQTVWTADVEYIWGQRGHYDEVRRWATTKPVAPVVSAPQSVAPPTKASSLRKPDDAGSNWVRGPAAQWPQVVMRNEIRFKDGLTNSNTLSFLMNAKGGVVAISALTAFATTTPMPAMRGLPSYNIYQPIPLDTFRARLVSWTMTAPQSPQKQWPVISIEPRSRPASDHGHAVVLTLAPARGLLPVRVLASQAEAGPAETFLRKRVYVMSCGSANDTCKQAALVGTITSQQNDSAGKMSSLAITLDEHFEWSDLVGSPAIDEDGFVLGVVSGPQGGWAIDRKTDATYLTVEEIHRVLANAAVPSAP